MNDLFQRQRLLHKKVFSKRWPRESNSFSLCFPQRAFFNWVNKISQNTLSQKSQKKLFVRPSFFTLVHHPKLQSLRGFSAFIFLKTPWLQNCTLLNFKRGFVSLGRRLYFLTYLSSCKSHSLRNFICSCRLLLSTMAKPKKASKKESWNTKGEAEAITEKAWKSDFLGAQLFLSVSWFSLSQFLARFSMMNLSSRRFLASPAMFERKLTFKIGRSSAFFALSLSEPGWPGQNLKKIPNFSENITKHTEGFVIKMPNFTIHSFRI